MAGKELIDLLMETRAEKQKYYEDVWRYVRMMRDIARSRDPAARVLVFGSFVKGCMRPDSDIDVLIITDEARETDRRIRLKVEILRTVGFVNPFQIHMATPQEYEGWYKRFIDKHVEV
ncbi:MAG: nucleotidyltransferase domain-containing protein [Candidatus Caldarchaeum sp.]|nr:nucleotidyltransferase domain-containing protein [Candidatus Caldarchaeum sp.]